MSTQKLVLHLFARQSDRETEYRQDLYQPPEEPIGQACGEMLS